jgi:Mor family transcriptional regulator
MNLRDVNALIQQLEREGDDELVTFYKRKRAELIAILNRDIVKHIKGRRR